MLESLKNNDTLSIRAIDKEGKSKNDNQKKYNDNQTNEN